MISSKCHYAVLAMLELAKQEGSGPVAISDIAREQHIPARFLEAILRQLKQAGFTDSARGKDGGYFLARPARAIHVGQVIRLFEGPLVSAPPPAPAGRGRRKGGSAVLADLWEQANAALASVLDGVDFAQLAAQDRARAMKFVMDYAI
jgi:Rrf2 family cysteine metabolism transcriptional repressor